MQSDESLIQQAKKGNKKALQDLIGRYEQLVRSTVFGMLGNSPEAEDVAQEVFIRFYQKLDQYRGDAQLGTYLSRIAINLSLNELKRRKRNHQRFTFLQRADHELPIADPSADPDKQDTKDLVWKALQLLEPDFRTVVVLRMIDGYSVKETAQILKMPEGTVASRLARAQKKLKSILEKWMH